MQTDTMTANELQKEDAMLPLVPVSVHVEIGRVNDGLSAQPQPTPSKLNSTIVRVAPASTLAAYAVPLLSD